MSPPPASRVSPNPCTGTAPVMWGGSPGMPMGPLGNVAGSARVRGVSGVSGRRRLSGPAAVRHHVIPCRAGASAGGCRDCGPGLDHAYRKGARTSRPAENGDRRALLVGCVELRRSVLLGRVEFGDQRRTIRRPILRSAGEQRMDDLDEPSRQGGAQAGEVGRITLESGERCRRPSRRGTARDRPDIRTARGPANTGRLVRRASCRAPAQGTGTWPSPS